MRRVLIALALVVAACGGSAAPTTPDSGEGAAAAATSSSTTAPTDVAPGSDTRERPEGPDAPQFTLALGEGGEFDLSAEQKPVHMVFWAEW